MLPAPILPLTFRGGLSRLLRRRPGNLRLLRRRARPLRCRWRLRRWRVLLPPHLLLLLLLALLL